MFCLLGLREGLKDSLASFLIMAARANQLCWVRSKQEVWAHRESDGRR